MEFKTTSTERCGRQAAALVEFIIAMAIGSMLLLSAGALTSYSARSYSAMANYTDLDNLSRRALDHLSRDVRQAKRLSSFSAHQLVLTDFDDQPLSYTYDPVARTLVRTKTIAEVLLTQCDFLRFNIYQRNPIGGTYDQYPTATATNCKVIQVSWVCSRRILGARINTESVQSAKIVIRKQ